MSSETSSPQADDSAQTNTQPYSQLAATHIRELSDISQQLPGLLRKCATVMSLLTNQPIQLSTPASSPTARIDTIGTTTHDLLLLINQIRALLKDQVSSLQAASVIPAEPTRFIAVPVVADPSAQNGQEQQSQQVERPESSVKKGGLGQLDIASLNARAGVKQGGDEDVLARVQEIVDALANME